MANGKSEKACERSFGVVEDDDDWSDYPLPGRRRDEVSEVIPTPGVGKGMGIVLIILIANAIIGFLLQQLLENDRDLRANRRGRDFFDDSETISKLATLPIGFLVMAGLLFAMLPTRFGRACLVTVYYCLICIGIVLVIGVPLLAIGVAVGIR